MNIYDRITAVADLRYDKTVPTSHTKIEDGKLIVTCGKMFLDSDRATKEYLLEHELAHIIRGDLLTMKNLTGGKTEDVDKHIAARKWNIAADACIHKHLRPSLGEGPENVVTLEKLQEQYEKVKECDGSAAMPIYDRIPDPEKIECPCSLSEEEIKELTPEERAVYEHARAVASKMAGNSPITIRHQRAQQYQETTAERIVRQVADRVHASPSGALKRVRSWSRPGRIATIPGQARRRAAKIAVAVDVSGSMEAAHAAIDYLARLDNEVTWISWATTAAIVPNAKEIHNADVGGGTMLQPALDLAESVQPNHLVIISDAYIGDSPPHPSFPVTWVIVGEGKAPWGVEVRAHRNSI